MGRRFTAFVFVLALLFPCFALYAFADEGGEGGAAATFSGTDSATVIRLASDIIDNFNLPTVKWEGNCLAAESFDFYPFTPYEGTRSLKFSGAIKTSLSDPPEIWRYLCVTFFSENDVTVSVRAEGTGFAYSSSAYIRGGEWRTVLFDLEDEEMIERSGRQKTVRINSITFDAGDGNSVIADLCAGIRNGQCGQILGYMCESFSAQNGSVFENGGAYVFSYGAGGYFSGVPFNPVFTRGTGIEVTVENNSSSGSLTLEYETAMGKKTVTRKLLQSSLPQSVLFGVDDGNVTRLRFVPEENSSGQIIFTSLRRVSAAVPSVSADFQETCRIARDRKSVAFSAAMGEDYNGYEAYLFSFAPGESVIFSGRSAVAQSTVSDGQVSFGIAIGGQANEIFRKYVCAVNVAGEFKAVGEPVFPSNPEILAREKSAFEPAGIKGSGITGGEYIADFLSHTCVFVRLEELLKTDGSQISVNDDFSPRLDKKMNAFARQGILVTVVLEWNVTGDPAVDRVLFNSSGRPVPEAVRAASSYIAGRYGSSDGYFCLNGIQLGRNANETFALPYESLESASSYYADLCRVVYTALKSVNGSLEMFVPLGGRWYRENGTEATGFFSALEFMRALNEKIYVSNGIRVSLSYDIWCGEGSESYVSDCISSGNLALFCRAAESLGFDGIILLGGEYESDGNRVILDSAEYAFIYSAVCTDGLPVDAIIPLHDCGYENTLRYVDGKYAGEKLKYVGELYGAGVSESLARLAINPVKNITETTLLNVVPSSVRGEAPLFDFSSSADGFEPSDYCAGLQPGVTLGEKSGILSVDLENTESYCLKGIEASFDTPKDFSGIEYFGAGFMLTKAPEGRDTAEVLVVLRSGSSVYCSFGQINDSGFTTLVADITGFSKRDETDGIGIYVLTDGQQTILIDNVRIMSESYSANQIIDIVKKSDPKPEYPLKNIIVASSLAVVCFAAETARIIVRKRKNNSQEV